MCVIINNINKLIKNNQNNLNKLNNMPINLRAKELRENKRKYLHEKSKALGKELKKRAGNDSGSNFERYTI